MSPTTRHDGQVDQGAFSLATLPRPIATTVRELHRIDRRWNFVALAIAFLWAVLAVGLASLPSEAAFLPLKLGAMVAIGICIQALAILMHEALHGNFFRNARLDAIAAFILGVPAFFSGAAYRVAHLHHHRHTRGPEDQDELSTLCATRRQYALLYYAWFFLGTGLYVLIVPWKAFTLTRGHERRRILLEYLGVCSIYATAAVVAIQHNAGWMLLTYWLIPAQCAIALTSVRGLAEHLGTDFDHPLRRTRTTTSNAFVSLTMLNLNYHLEHHLFPGVPWYHLRRLHLALKPVYAESGVFVSRSYVRYAIQAFLHGPPETDTSGDHSAAMTLRSPLARQNAAGASVE